MDKLTHTSVYFLAFRSFPSFLLIAALLVGAFSVSASESLLDATPLDEEGFLIEPNLTAPEDIPGTVSCFDHYTFGSVDVSLSPVNDSTVSGVPLHFTGTVTNENPYPLVSISVYAKVFGVDLGGERDAVGPDVFGVYLIRDNIHLPANGTKELSFVWDVPSTLPTGDYQLATFVVSGNAFNMAGLLFSEDIVASSVPFRIKGERDAAPIFIKSRTTLNGERYRFVAGVPHVDSGESVTVEHSVTNPTGTNEQVSVSWTLYSWDSLQDGMVSTVIEESGDSAVLKPGETTTFSYTTTHSDHPVYYLVAEASYRDLTSVAAVRFVRSGVQSPRLNFIGTDRFPLMRREEATVFACVHGMGAADVLEDNTVSLTITDSSGRKIHSYTYEGDITGSVMGLADTFSPSHTADRFTITAELMHGGEVVDRKELHYDCNDIDPDTCTSFTFATASTMDPITAAALITIVFIGVIALAALIHKRRRML